MNDNYSVYKHTNRITGKSYIGITNDIKTRWAGSGCRYKTYGGVFGNAIDKYGWDNFTHEILADNLTHEDACLLEKHYIALFQTNICRYGNSFGYNMTDGGDGLPSYCHTESTKQLISERLADPNSDTLARMSEASLGRQGFSGQNLSKEHKEKLKKGLTIANSRRGKPVFCETNCKAYKSISDAARELDVSMSSIRSVCRGERDSACGYRFRFMDRDEAAQFNIFVYPRVMCIDTGEIFESAKEAAKHIGVPMSYITHCCDGKQTSTRGLKWQYIN